MTRRGAQTRARRGKRAWAKRRRPICKITILTRFLFHPLDRKNHRRFGFQFKSMFMKMKLPTTTTATRAARLAESGALAIWFSPVLSFRSNLRNVHWKHRAKHMFRDRLSLVFLFRLLTCMRRVVSRTTGGKEKMREREFCVTLVEAPRRLQISFVH